MTNDLHTFLKNQDKEITAAVEGKTLIDFINRNADLRQDTHRQDGHTRGRALGFDRECQGQDPGQGRHPARSATPDLRRQAA